MGGGIYVYDAPSVGTSTLNTDATDQIMANFASTSGDNIYIA